MAETPIRMNISTDEEAVDTSHLKFGASTPGTLATTGSFFTPLSVFSSEGMNFVKKHDFGGETDEDASIVSRSERLGISRPKYYDDDDASQTSTVSARIGITRGCYDLPEGDFPISPTNLYLEKKSSSPTPQLIEIDDEFSTEYGGNWRSAMPMPSRDNSEQSVRSNTICTEDEIADDIPRLIHKHTADGHYLVSSKPLDTSIEGMRYNITEGKRSMTRNMRHASEGRLGTTKSRILPPRSASMQAIGSTASVPLDASFKVFILLLQPKSKIFELIQVIYSPSLTTVGDVINMIPENATEPALGSQNYVGLARPKDGSEITDFEMMASGSNEERDCALITQGEILVAIPYGYTGKTCASISKPIFANSRIRKLLRRSDPLAAKRKKKSRRSRPRRSGAAPGVATVNEEEEADFSVASSHEAVNKGTAQAADATVADIPRTTEVDVQSLFQSTGSFESRPSLERVDADDSQDLSVSSTVSGTETLESSLNNSYNFQKPSKRIPRRGASRSRLERTKKRRYMYHMMAAAFALMVCRYLSQAQDDDDDDDDDEDESGPMDHVLGILGLFQAMIFFFAMIDLQRRANSKSRSSKSVVADLDKKFRKVAPVAS